MARGGMASAEADDGMETDVLIVGGGLAGCLTAWLLAEEGVDALVIERGVLNGGASAANAGSLHLQIPFPEFVGHGDGWAAGFAPVLPMMRESVALWRGLGARAGVDLEVQLTGGLLVAATEAQMTAVARKVALERGYGVEIEMLTRDELRALAPYVSDRMIGGAFCPGEGKANPLRAGPAVAAAARAAGARLHPGVTLQALERDGAGWSATTSEGAIRAGRVVNAAGAEAGRVAAMVGLDLAIEGWPIQATVTEPAAPFVPHLVYSGAAKLTLKQMANGSCIIGGGWPSRLTPRGLRVDPASLAANMATALATVPALAGLRALRSWPALVNGTADWRPVLGEAPGRPGFFMALFPWMGFTAAPMTARIVADLVMGREAPVDPALLMAG